MSTGVLAGLCLILAAGAASLPCAAKLDRQDHSSKTVHVVFSNHLDIGFDGIDPQLGTDDAVINKYFDVYFQRAIATAEQLRASNSSDRYIWMTHAYLISLYMDCPPGMGLHCPSAKERAAVEAAIREGIITWHAFPHNAQIELMDADMVEFAIDMVHELDRTYGFLPKRTMSQRDVPGLTRAAVPVLANPGWQIGLEGISVGVNGGSAPPDVPRSTPFLYRDVASSAQLIAMWHAGGYSGNPVDSADECMKVKGFEHILCCAWRGDNGGPHSPHEVRRIMKRVRRQFPGAHVQASTFDAFVLPLADAVRAGLELPVITKEIGDTWINGVASDAGKVADYRAMQRMRRKLSYDHSQDPAYRNLSRFLLKVPEHTWGADVKKAMPDYRNWSNADFHAALAAGAYTGAVHCWKRQRAYLDWGLQALSASAPGQAAAAALLSAQQQLTVAPVVSDGRLWRREWPRRLWSPHWDLELKPRTGALAGLRKRWGSRHSGNWAHRHSPLGQVTYSTYTEADYDAIWKHYAYLPDLPEWFYKDFGKPNCSRFASPRREDTVAVVEDAWVRQHTGTGFHMAMKLAFPQKTVTEAGAPAAVWLEYASLANSSALYLDVTWVDKTATRLPEALWVDWEPSTQQADPESWRLWKLGSPIDPADVLFNGSRSLHAVGDRGFHVDSTSGRERLSIRPLDVALVSPGAPTPFPNPDRQPDLARGMHSLLANNIWGTNYVMWQPYRPEDRVRRFRFVLQVEDLLDGQREERWSDEHLQALERRHPLNAPMHLGLGQTAEDAAAVAQ